MSQLELPGKVFAFTQDKRLFSTPCHVLLGVSGGADSVALLHLLTRWPREGIHITAMHIHHGLRGVSADRDAAFVEQLCADWGVPLVCVRADVASVAREAGIGLEEAGRRERYRLFEQTRCELGADFILTAHTASDRTETVLMHILRGCGTDGLCGIPAARGVVRRPLLCCTRGEVEDYCRRHTLPYMTDETNADIRYTRNRIRHQLLPLLRQLNPSADAALCRLSEHAAEDSRYLQEQAEAALDAAMLADHDYTAEAFVAQAKPIRRRMIYRVLAQFALPQISEAHIVAVEKLLLQGCGETVLPTGLTLRVEDGRLFSAVPSFPVSEAVNIIAMPFTFSWLGESYRLQLFTPGNDEEWKKVHKMFFKSSIDYDRIQGSLCIRCRTAGDTMHPADRGVGKKLKKLMNEWRIPATQRDGFPLLCDEAGVLLVPGYGCDERVRVSEATKHFLVWQKASEQG